MDKNFKQQPDNNWLTNLDQYRSSGGFDEMGVTSHPWPGPWYSDDGEDGVLNYLFEYINDSNKFAVDIGSAHGYGGSQIRHLVDKYEWNSAEIDGGNWNPMHPRVHQEWFNINNICNILEKLNTPKQFDLLSLDIDSMDYYILEKLLVNGYRFNVAIIEFNPIFGYNEPYVRAYDESYRKDSTSNYGASLRAFEMLLNEAEYTLVHTFDRMESRKANNAIFISNKFISKDTKIIPSNELYSDCWIESWKHRNVQFGNTLDEIKTNLCNESFIKLEA